MTSPSLFDYYKDFIKIQPSLFRESNNLHKLMRAILKPFEQQQEDFLWLSQNIFNVDVAEGYHLDLIGLVVGQPRFLIGFKTEPFFGFEGSYQSDSFGTSGLPFVGGFWNSRSYFNTASSRTLNDEEYRRIIKARVINNNSNNTTNDLVEVVNLITGRTDNTVQMIRHGLIRIGVSDKSGFMAYFADRLPYQDNILPIAAGVRLEVDNVYDDGSDLGIYKIKNPLEKLVNIDLPFDERVWEFIGTLDKLVNISIPRIFDNEDRTYEDNPIGYYIQHFVNNLDEVVNEDLPTTFKDS